MYAEIKTINTTDFDKAFYSSADTPFAAVAKDYDKSQQKAFIGGSIVSTASAHYIVIDYVQTLWCGEDSPCGIKASILAADPYERIGSDIEIYGIPFITINEVNETEIEELNKYYSFQFTSDLENYLQSHKAVINALIKTARYIKILFNKQLTRLILSLNQDCDENYQGVTVTIQIAASPEEALSLLDKFDEGWWLDRDAEIRSAVTILVRSV